MVIHEQQRETSKEFTNNREERKESTKRTASKEFTNNREERKESPNSKESTITSSPQREQQGAGVSEASGLRPMFF
jgi:hypothetical protein